VHEKRVFVRVRTSKERPKRKQGGGQKTLKKRKWARLEGAQERKQKATGGPGLDSLGHERMTDKQPGKL